MSELTKITALFEHVYNLAVFDIQVYKKGWKLFIPTIEDDNMNHIKNTLPMTGYYLAEHDTYKDSQCFITISKIPE